MRSSNLKNRIWPHHHHDNMHTTETLEIKYLAVLLADSGLLVSHMQQVYPKLEPENSTEEAAQTYNFQRR